MQLHQALIPLVCMIMLLLVAPIAGKWVLRNPKVHKKMTVELNEPTICDPSVQQYSGFIDISDTQHYFFWFMESKADPLQDDLILWLNGGPGCSSLFGMLGEYIGPCSIDLNQNEIPNVYSWNYNASLIFIDAPVGAGFSYGTEYTITTPEYANDLYAFFQLFFAEFPQYQTLGFNIFGESYAGHYVPATGARIARGNLESGTIKINLKSIAVGNGLTDPITQYPFYAQIGCNNSYNIPVFTQETCDFIESKTPPCLERIQECYDAYDWNICVNATLYCNLFLVGPIELSGLNQYDIRQPCCYDFSHIDAYLNSPEIKEELGTTGRTWHECNNKLFKAFRLVGADWMKGVLNSVLYLLRQTDTRLLFYLGDADYLVNFFGVENMVHSFDWIGKDQFANTPLRTWLPNGEDAGQTKSYGQLSYLRIYEAGHMAPMDQPERLQMMALNWIYNRPLDAK